ncbi:hypothetical protein [Legionella sp.]|uniref:hypothetical protein n=2 Tax=Legionella TaxID=445 RepID=UPI000CC86AAE|nr:hypothetical protein [Legionella sp.]PJE06868.1 MAG: hypothetical protein CK430_14635 [Legionella sp.]
MKYYQIFLPVILTYFLYIRVVLVPSVQTRKKNVILMVIGVGIVILYLYLGHHELQLFVEKIRHGNLNEEPWLSIIAASAILFFALYVCILSEEAEEAKENQEEF